MNLKSFFKSCIPFFTVCAGFMFLGSCVSDSFQKQEGMIWNTTFHITYKGSPSLKDSVLATLDDVSSSLNVFNKESLICKANNSDSCLVDSHFMKVYTYSRIVNAESNGMFDPTLSPLISVWGFGPGHEVTADTLAVDSILEYVGIEKTRLVGNCIVKDNPHIQFNFSAIAKGYGCDAVADMLKRNGVEDYLVEIGGEIALGGNSPKGGKWKISVDKPVMTDSTEVHDSAMVIALTDAGVATSGNYRNFHKQGEKTFGHTISPITGRPVATDVISATVIAGSSMEADAVATACMAAGSEKAKSMIGSLGMEGMLILSDSTIWTSTGFNQLNASER